MRLKRLKTCKFDQNPDQLPEYRKKWRNVNMRARETSGKSTKNTEKSLPHARTLLNGKTPFLSRKSEKIKGNQKTLQIVFIHPLE